INNFSQVGIMSLVPDLRGRGQSVDETWGRGDIHSLSRMVSDVKELRKAHSKEIGELPIFVGGISFGALIAMLYVRDEPQGIKGLLIAGPPFGNRSQAAIQGMRMVAKLHPKMPVRNAPTAEEVYETPEFQERIRKDPYYNRAPLRAEAAAKIL